MSAEPEQKVYYILGIPVTADNIIDTGVSHEDLGHEKIVVALVEEVRVKFQVGEVYITPGAREFCEQYQVDPRQLVARHQTGDHGTLDADDIQVNIEEGYDGDRVLSAYYQGADKVWVITDPGHESTTVLTPDEY
jgi:hypothetical protein